MEFKIENYNLLQGLMRACNLAAIESYKLMGKSDEKGADFLAVKAMREALNSMDIDGKIAIGEGERDEAPMLFIGEKLGSGLGPKIDIAVDPLEGTTILATGGFGAMSVIAATDRGGFLEAPDTYMHKIATGFNFPEQIIDLDLSIKENLTALAKAQKKDLDQLVVIVLDRPRHKELIAKIREENARVKLISDGDISAIIQTTYMGRADLYVGIGGAPEGVLSAAALQTLGGQMCARLIIRNEEEKAKTLKMNITDLDKKYYLNDLASGDVVFAATGVTDGELLKGVRYKKNIIKTYSLLMSARQKTVQMIKTKTLI
ncbi:MAG: class II fructose-bisphosphatase [Rickettsiaceae bacterium]|nr:class II fructose-bisphosphatase [Rickettsiaceae bacterium]